MSDQKSLNKNMKKSCGFSKVLATEISREILDKFPLLTKGDHNTRIKEIHSFTKMLLKNQERYGLHLDREKTDELCPEIRYSLRRLIQGLASNKNWARPGFSVALSQLLALMPAIKIDDILQLVDSTLKHSQQDSKSETGQISLGRLMAYMILVQSGKLTSQKKSAILEVMKRACDLKKVKSYLVSPCYRLLRELVTKVPEKMFKKHVWPAMQAELGSGWKTCNADTLMLLMSCVTHHPETVTEAYLTEHWGSSTLWCKQTYGCITDVIAQSSGDFRLACSAVDALVSFARHTNTDLIILWQRAGENLLHLSTSKKLVAMHLFISLQNHMSTPEQGIPTISWYNSLHPVGEEMSAASKTSEFSKLFTTNLVVKLHELLNLKSGQGYNKAMQVMNVLESRSRADGQIAVMILSTIIKSQVSIKFAWQLKQKHFHGLVLNLPDDWARVFAKEMFKLVGGTSDWINVESQNVSERELRLWAVAQLQTLVTLPSTGRDDEWQGHILQFLALHGFFTILRTNNDITHLGADAPVGGVPKQLQQESQESFFRAVTHLIKFNPDDGKKKRSLNSYVGVLHKLVQYIQMLILKDDVVTFVNPLSPDGLVEWKKMLNVMDKIIGKKGSCSELSDQACAFVMLFLYLGLQLLTHSADVIDLLQDVHVCYEKAFLSRRKSAAAAPSSTDEPSWIEVVTELLVSLITQDSRLSLTMATNVLSLLSSHITPEALTVILNVLRSGRTSSQTGDDSPLAFEEDSDEENKSDDDDGDDDDEAPENEDVDDSESDSDDSGVENDSEDEVEEEEVSNEFRGSVRSALGHLAAAEGEDEESDVDLSDGEMFKLDSYLAEAFRSMTKVGRKKQQKENEKQIVNFKLRALGLLDNIMKNQMPLSLVIPCLPVLLELMETSWRKEQGQVLAEKATKVFHTLLSSKKISNDNSFQPEELLLMLKDFIKLSTKVSNVPMVKEVSSACSFMIRLMLQVRGEAVQHKPRPHDKDGQDKEKVVADLRDEILSVLKAGLDDFFTRREPKLHQVFFHNILNRHQLQLWPLSNTMLHYIGNADVRIQMRTQACSLLCCLLTRSTPQQADERSWKSFSSEFVTTISNVLGSIQRDNLKPFHTKEILVLLVKAVSISQDIAQQLPEQLLDKIQSLKSWLDTDGRKSCNRIKTLVSITHKAEKRKPGDKDLSTETCQSPSKKGHHDTDPSVSKILEAKGKSHKNRKMKSQRQLDSKLSLFDSTLSSDSQPQEKSTKRQAKKRRQSETAVQGQIIDKSAISPKSSNVNKSSVSRKLSKKLRIGEDN